MPVPLLHALRITSRTRRFVPSLTPVLVATILTVGLLAHAPQHASAEATTVAQCNDDTASNQAGQGIACTITIVNYVTATGSIDPARPSIVTVTRCTGAAGSVATGAGTCVTHTTTSAGSIASVRQCNGSGNGGGGVVICSTTVTNYFSGSPATAPTAATVYQCAGSAAIPGTGASGICIPADSLQTTSATGATIAQCNGSGNGGPNAGFICSVTGGSTTTAALPVRVEQCNHSGNGGGALMNCRTTVMHVIARLPVTLAVTPAAARLAAPAVVPGHDVPQAISVQAVQVPPSPPATGNAGFAAQAVASHTVLAGSWLLGLTALALLPGGRWLVARTAAQ